MKRILVCEDEDVIRDFVVINLKRAGYEVIDVNCGEEASRVFDEEHGDFDIVLLDIMMPGTLNGLEVCRQIKADHATRFTKVVLLTARVQAGDKEAGLAAGADDYLMKPFSTLQVLETIYRMEAEA